MGSVFNFFCGGGKKNRLRSAPDTTGVFFFPIPILMHLQVTSKVLLPYFRYCSYTFSCRTIVDSQISIPPTRCFLSLALLGHIVNNSPFPEGVTFMFYMCSSRVFYSLLKILSIPLELLQFFI